MKAYIIDEAYEIYMVAKERGLIDSPTEQLFCEWLLAGGSLSVGPNWVLDATDVEIVED